MDGKETSAISPDTGGGEKATRGSTIRVDFVPWPLNELRGRSKLGAAPSSSSVSHAFCLYCFPSHHHLPISGWPTRCLLMADSLLVSHYLDLVPRPNATNASWLMPLLLKYGNPVSGVVHIRANKVPRYTFHYPKKTEENVVFALPGMTVGKDLWPGVIRMYRTGPWNGRQASGYPYFRTFQLIISPAPADVKVTLGYVSWLLEASFSLVTTRKDGVVQRTVWGPSSPAMNRSSLGECAPSSFCICLNASRTVSVSPMDWGTPGTSLLNASPEPDCGKSGAADLTFVARDVQQHSAALEDASASVQLERCRLRCGANLTCLAFASVEVGTDSRCITWTTSLADEKFYSSSERWMFLRPLFPNSSWALVAVILWIIAPAFYFLLNDRMKKWRTGMPCPKISSVDTGVDLPQDNIVRVASMDFAAVRTATGGFAKRNIVGEGGFAIVYKGKLSKNHVLARGVHKRMVAVKRLKQSTLSLEGSDYFDREVELMSKLGHGNLVRLVAYCDEGDERILLYEYMQNKSLDRYIFGQNVIHRDLKPSNVLLDHKWTSKIADFGTTKLLLADDTRTQTIVFSHGYAAPEYIRGDVTLKCDVYSFGVVLLEIISGQKNSTTPSLLSHAWKLWDEHRITDLVDPEMAPPRSQVELWSRLRRFIQIGLLCVQELPGDRPNISQVLAMLTCSNDSEPRKPKAPAVLAMSQSAK